MITIKETTLDDIKNVQSLWADGDVMKFVGFPDGYHTPNEEMADWFDWIVATRPMTNDFAIYEDSQYCGEVSYDIDPEQHSASLDIKLLKFARGRGIATMALTHSIDQAFKNGAEFAWVDPNPENEKALALYNRLGFVKKPMPQFVIDMGEDPDFYVYMELDKKSWQSR